MRELIKNFGGELRLTSTQNVVFCVPDDRVAYFKEMLVKYDLGVEQHTGIRLHSMSCVGLPTCGLAMVRITRGRTNAVLWRCCACVAVCVLVGLLCSLLTLCWALVAFCCRLSRSATCRN
jgi:hypothetical protein